MYDKAAYKAIHSVANLVGTVIEASLLLSAIQQARRGIRLCAMVSGETKTMSTPILHVVLQRFGK